MKENKIKNDTIKELLLLHQLNIAEKTQAEIKNIKAQKRRWAGALQAFATQRFFIYVKYFWQGLVGGAIGIYYFI